MTTHTITLARHTAQVVGLMGVLVLGTWDSYGTEQLLLRHGPEWEGLAIDATFHNVPNDEGVTVLADTDGLVTVPPEACMRASKYATITIRGVQDGVQRISCNLPYMVLDHAQVPGANSTATPSENAQALAQMQDLRDGAVDAKNQAEAARDDAARSAVAAKEYETDAGQSATAAKTAQSAAETAKAGAETAQKAAASSASSASTSASTATTQAAAAKSSAMAAKASETTAGKSAQEAAASAANLDSAVNTATQKAAAEKAKVAAEAAQKDAAASKAAAANSSAAAKTSEDAAAKSAADADSTANSIKESMTQIAALQKRQNVLVGSEIGNPASCDDAFAAPLCGLSVYGKSTQNGTPTPDAPVPIVSAGDGGSVAVRVTGKNLLNPALFQNNKYQGFNAETGYYGIDSVNGYWITGIQPCLPSTTYHFNAMIEGGCFYDEKKNVIGIADFAFTIKTPAKCAYYCFNFSSVHVSYGTPIIATVSESTAYSPYREQLLTLPTPNGLPGIPVTSGGNYTDPQGQQWVCDEVDLERGVKVQRVDKAAFDSTKTLAEQNAILTTPIENPLTPAEIAAYKALTAYAPDTVVQAGDGAGVKLEYQRDVNIAIKKLEDAIASMTAT